MEAWPETEALRKQPAGGRHSPPWLTGPDVLGELLCLTILARLCTVSLCTDA